MTEIQENKTVKLTPEQERARRRRSAAIGLGLAGMVLVFYAASVVKFGPALLSKAAAPVERNQ